MAAAAAAAGGVESRLVTMEGEGQLVTMRKNCRERRTTVRPMVYNAAAAAVGGVESQLVAMEGESQLVEGQREVGGEGGAESAVVAGAKEDDEGACDLD